MLFWTIFFILGVFTYILAAILNKSHTEKITLFYTIVIWVIGAFRLNIGTDYSTYEIMYNSITDLSSWNEGIEPTFSFIALLLNYCEFNSQMLFVVYETVIIGFIYAGVKKYLNNKLVILIVIVLYVVFPTNGGYWWELNAMRQAAAISVAFYSSGFFMERKYIKFALTFLLACLFHYSAIVFIAIFLYRKVFSIKLISILLALGFVLNFTGITARAVMYIMSFGAEIVGRYEADIFIAAIGTSSFSITACWFSILYLGSAYLLKKEKLPYLILNGSSIYILLRVYMSFGIEDSLFATVIHRFEAYFLPFYLALLSIAIHKILVSYRYRVKAVLATSIIAISFSVLLLNVINKQNEDVMAKIVPGASAGNIEYDFNFDLFK